MAATRPELEATIREQLTRVVAMTLQVSDVPPAATINRAIEEILGAAFPGKRKLQPCGTRAAYTRHKRRSEDPCGPCEEANRADARRRRKDGS